MLTRLE
jgi:hypothetical protein